MSTIHPFFAEHPRKRWMRPDAYRFAWPGSPETKMSSYLHRAAVARAEDDAKARAADEQDEFEREVLALRHDFAKLKLEYELRRFQRKYSRDQPRVPAGNPQGGQWTNGSATGDSVRISVVDPRDSAGLVISDATPDGVWAWAQYAETADQKSRDDAAIARTTVTLHNTVVQVSGAVVRRPDVSPRDFGTEVHVAFARTVRALDLSGVGTTGVEQSFDKNGEARYGKDGSIRTDVVLRNEEQEIIAIYDLKTGSATIRPPRASELRAMTGAGPDVPVIELHAVRGPARR